MNEEDDEGNEGGPHFDRSNVNADVHAAAAAGYGDGNDGYEGGGGDHEQGNAGFTVLSLLWCAYVIPKTNDSVIDCVRIFLEALLTSVSLPIFNRRRHGRGRG